MAEELPIGGAHCLSWWSSSMSRTGDVDGQLASCSALVGGDLGGNFGWSPTANEVAPEGNAACFSNSPASCITSQDSQTLQLSDPTASRHAMDISSKLSVPSFASPSVDHWSQSFLGESPDLYPFRDTSHEIFTDPSSSETAMNYIQLLSSLGTPYLGDEVRSYSEILTTSKPMSLLSINTAFDINGSAASQHMHFTKSRENEQKPKFYLHHVQSNSEEVGKLSERYVLKKPRVETPSPLPTFKVRKEKLGDRITALQQLVSPFGKTDTASVLYEAIEYIKFLHEQVRTLSSPYFRNGNQITHQQSIEREEIGNCPRKELRSRGLCVVPISSTFAVACGEIPAVDFWAPPAFDLNYI